MKTIVIDDEPWMIYHFKSECVGVDQIELVGSFRSPLAALEYARENPVELACVDIEMPRMTGPEVAKQLRELNPEVKILFVSAYDENDVEQLSAFSGWAYLRKPYKRDELRSAVERAEKCHA